jgi:hypothetical protein
MKESNKMKSVPPNVAQCSCEKESTLIDMHSLIGMKGSSMHLGAHTQVVKMAR